MKHTMGSSPLSASQALAPLDRLRARHLVLGPRAPALPTGLVALDALLPDGGLPRGAVVELCAASGLGQSTRLALCACASAQQQAQAEAGLGAQAAWCAWIDASGSLFAPGVVRAGVELGRLLVLRPRPEAVARLAVRLASSQLFSVLVVERAGVPGTSFGLPRARWELTTRRLALALEGSECTVVLLSSLEQARVEHLPVALRLELTRPERAVLQVRVSKERHGRLRGPERLALGAALGPEGRAA
jgi:recombination protein RecA